jgi:hypothetical protein
MSFRKRFLKEPEPMFRRLFQEIPVPLYGITGLEPYRQPRKLYLLHVIDVPPEATVNTPAPDEKHADHAQNGGRKYHQEQPVGYAYLYQLYPFLAITCAGQAEARLLSFLPQTDGRTPPSEPYDGFFHIYYIFQSYWLVNVPSQEQRAKGCHVFAFRRDGKERSRHNRNSERRKGWEYSV